MKSRLPALLLALTLALNASPLVPAQTTKTSGQAAANTQDWQGLRDLERGKKVLIEFKDGSTVHGNFQSAIGSRLTLFDDGGVYSADQREIQRVYRLKGGWSRRVTARIGAGIGFVAGSIIGGRRMSRLERDPNHTPSDADEIPLIAGMSLGTIAGAGVGALLGGKRKGKLLYEAK